MTSPDAEFIAFRCTCGKKLRLPITAAGRLAKCPKCGHPVRVPTPMDALAAPEESPPPGVDELRLENAPPPAMRQPAAAKSSATPHSAAPDRAGDFALLPLPPETQPADAADAELTQACPACGRGWPGAAKVCIDCGVYLATGKAIITTQEDDLDETYMKAQSVLSFVSWVNWVGLFPLTSEAFGLRRPHVIRTIAIATIIASVAFFFSLWPDQVNGGRAGNLMLWGGDRERSAVDWSEYAAMLRDVGYTEAEIRVEVAAERRRCEAGRHDFAYYQLLTHQFLHADVFHLLGNLIFLFLLGSRVNSLIGQTWTAVCYPILGVAAALVQLSTMGDRPWTYMIGASGAIAGLAGMYLVFFPVQRIHMVFWSRFSLSRLFALYTHFFAMRGFWVVLWYFGFDVLYIYFGIETGVAYWAHLGGFVTGVALALLLLVARQVNGRGGDLLSVLLGRHAWALIGRPRTTG